MSGINKLRCPISPVSLRRVPDTTAIEPCQPVTSDNAFYTSSKAAFQIAGRVPSSFLVEGARNEVSLH